MPHDIITIKTGDKKSEPFFCPVCRTKMVVKYNPDHIGKVVSISCPNCKESLQVKIEPADSPKPGIPLKEGAQLWGTTGLYTIRQVLGRGAFGISYLADAEMGIQTDEGWTMDEVNRLPVRSVSRQVVVKEFFIHDQMLRHSDGTVDLQSRIMAASYYSAFMKEAELLRQMRNEHIVTVYDSFCANNTAYYVMEYLEGGTLAQRWQGRHKLSDEQEAVNILTQVAYGVEYMHSRGFVHLDIKPHNIMRRGDGTWVLIDFGIARHKDPSSDTSAKPPLGVTAGYAPIEQYSNNPPLRALPLMDIYALGATCYWLCDGRPPEAYDVLNHGLPLQEWQAKGISPYTAHTVAKAMQPLYANRYQEVRQLIDDLRICQQYIGAMTAADHTHAQATPRDGETSTKPYQDDELPPTVPIYDNQYDGHTIIPLSVNGVGLMCEPGKDIKQIEKTIADMSPCPSVLLSKHPVETIGDDALSVILSVASLQSYTSLRLELPSDIMIEHWAKKHPFYSSDAPFLCFNGARAKLYEATVSGRRVTFQEADVSQQSRKLQLLVALNRNQPLQFMPSQWGFGFHPVCKDGKWGLLRHDGHIVIPTDFDKITAVGPQFIPAPGPPRNGFLGCRAEKGSTIFFYELAPMLTMKLKRCLTRKEYNELSDMT